MAYCSKCGREMAEGSQFCSGCGQSAGNPANVSPQTVYRQPVQPIYPQPNLLQQLSSKIKTDAILWIVIACLQFVIGFFNIAVGIALYTDYDDGMINLITGLCVWMVGVSNLVVSIRNMRYSKEVLVRPIGIVQRFQPVGGLIGTLVYNLLLGGFIGVIGTIYGFMLRNFVISNAAQFQAIEADYAGGFPPTNAS